jgi:hypothetical protein
MVFGVQPSLNAFLHAALLGEHLRRRFDLRLVARAQVFPANLTANGQQCRQPSDSRPRSACRHLPQENKRFILPLERAEGPG